MRVTRVVRLRKGQAWPRVSVCVCSAETRQAVRGGGGGGRAV